MAVTLNISITQKMRDYIDLQVKDGNYVSASDYIRALIRADSERRLEQMILEGMASGPGEPVNEDFWNSLDARLDARAAAAEKKKKRENAA